MSFLKLPRTSQPQQPAGVNETVWPGKSCIILPSIGRVGVFGAGPITALSENTPFSQISGQGRLIAWRPNSFTQPGEFEKWTTGEYVVGASFSMIAVMGYTNPAFPATVEYGGELGWGARLHVSSGGAEAQVVVSSNRGTTVSRTIGLRELVAVGMTKRGSILTLFCQGLTSKIDTGEAGVLRRFAGSGIDGQTSSLGIASLIGATDVALSDEAMRDLTSSPTSAYKIIAPISRNVLYSLPSSSDITVALTGQSVSAAAGQLSVAAAIPLSGQTSTAVTGSVGVAYERGLLGGLITTSAGIVAPATTVGLAGQSITSLTGTVVYQVTNDITVALTGTLLTASAGSVGTSRALILSSSVVTVAAGVITYRNDATAPPNNQLLAVPPPNLPVASPTYAVAQTEEERFRRVLRLYFVQVSNVLNLLVGDNGGAYLSVPYAEVVESTSQTATSTTSAYPVRISTTQYSSTIPLAPEVAAVTGSIATTTLTVSAVTSGVIRLGAQVTGAGVAANTFVIGFGTGSGGVGTYVINVSQTVASTALSVTTTSKLRVTISGLYSVRYSLQFSNTGPTAQRAGAWLMRNDLAVASSGQTYSVPGSHGGVNGRLLAPIEYQLELAEGDTIELQWYTENTAVFLEAVPAGASPTRPAVPSAKAAVNCFSRRT